MRTRQKPRKQNLKTEIRKTFSFIIVSKEIFRNKSKLKLTKETETEIVEICHMLMFRRINIL